MKMRGLLFFSILLFNISLVSAIGVSPASLTFNLDINEEGCRSIILSSGGQTSFEVFDRWAPEGVDEWSINLFTDSSDDHGLALNYPDLIEDLDGDKIINLCLTGELIGEHKGIIIFKGKSGGNIETAVGTWLRVNIQEENSQSPQNPTGAPSKSTNLQNENEIETETVEDTEQSENTDLELKELEGGAGLEQENIEGDVEGDIKKIEDETKSSSIALSVGLGVIILIVVVLSLLIIKWRKKKSVF